MPYRRNPINRIVATTTPFSPFAGRENHWLITSPVAQQAYDLRGRGLFSTEVAMETQSNQRSAAHTDVEARRHFLAACGKLALATPPAVTLLLAQAERSYAAALSGNAGAKQHSWLWEKRLRTSQGPRRTRNRPRPGEAEAEW